MMLTGIARVIPFVAFAAVALLDAGEAFAKGPKVRAPSSTAAPKNPPKSAKDDDRSPSGGREININLRSAAGTSAGAGPGAGPPPPGAAGMVPAGAAIATASSAAMLGRGVKETPEEAKARQELREAEMRAAEEEKQRLRAETLRLAEQAAADRARKLAEAERARAERQARALRAAGPSPGGCLIKAVMTDDEIAACRR